MKAFIETDISSQLEVINDHDDRIIELEKMIKELKKKIAGIHEWILDQSKLNEGFIDLLKKL
jgi:peptidoglycan hydrolase CwlO-like protein